MTLYREREAPRYPGEQVFRHSPLGPAILTLFFIGGLVALGALGWEVIARGVIPLLLALAVIGVCLLLTLLGALACWSATRACFRETNWLLKCSPSGFLVKFRSYMNHHFPDDDPSVVFIHASEIASVRKTKVRREVPTTRSRTVTQRLTYLDIRLVRPDTASLKGAISRERNRRAPRVGISRTRALHFPVSVPEPGLIRVEWKGLRTRIDRAFQAFGGAIRVEENREVDLGRLDQLTDHQLEDFILTLCEAGETIKAVAVIRRRYGWDITRAKQFAEELASGQKPLKKEDT